MSRRPRDSGDESAARRQAAGFRFRGNDAASVLLRSAHPMAQLPAAEPVLIPGIVRRSTGAARSRLRFSLARKQAAFGIAIILPTLAILAIFRFLPMVQALYLSLT